jgi:hypothetical protein
MTNEKLNNGGFELGDFTGWTTEGNPDIYHDPGYGAKGTDYWAHFTISDLISQEITPYPCNNIVTFELYYRVSGCTSSTLNVLITYSDDTTLLHQVDIQPWGEWVLLDLKSLLDLAKEIKKITVWFTSGGPWDGFVDEISLIGGLNLSQCSEYDEYTECEV